MGMGEARREMEGRRNEEIACDRDSKEKRNERKGTSRNKTTHETKKADSREQGEETID